MFLRYAFLADSTTIDTAGKLSAIGIFDHILTVSFPVVQRDMTLVANFECNASEKGQHQATVELRDSKANKLAEFKVTVAMENPGVTHASMKGGLVTRLQDLPFSKAGQYEFVIFIDDRFLGRVPFLIKQIPVKPAGEK